MIRKIISAGVLILLSLMCACSFFTVSSQEEIEIPLPHPGSTEDGWRAYTFTDTAGEEYKAAATPAYPPADFDPDTFVLSDDKLSYEDENYLSRLGVDVSYYQGDIDWEKVHEDGYSFAFIRLGFRGYSSEGGIHLDDRFLTNIKEAQAEGLDTGVYFFSQAVSEEEAAEEARFVIKTLKKHKIRLQLPVVYDLERVFESGSRTLQADDSLFTDSCLAFCREIADAGYAPAFYASMMWEAYTFDMGRLAEYPVWYADYVRRPQTPYSFSWWQYSCTARVDGIGTACDVNIQLIPKQ